MRDPIAFLSNGRLIGKLNSVLNKSLSNETEAVTDT